MVWLIALYLLIVATGVWLSRSGRPLKMLPSAAHKLLAVGFLVFTAIQLFGGTGFGVLPPVWQITGIVALAALISLFTTGAVLSGKKRKRGLVILHSVATVVILVCMLCWAFSALFPMALPKKFERVDYRLSDTSERIELKWKQTSGNIEMADEVNLYGIDRNQLREFDQIHYKKSFGRIDDAHAAAKVAAYMHEGIYGEPSGAYVIGYNENANAWIVYDELPEYCAGGCGVFAITKDSGEVIMGYHLK